MKIRCRGCKKEFNCLRSKLLYDEAVGDYANNCSKACRLAPSVRRSRPCLHCSKPTDNPIFCSRRCNAIVQNKLKPKRLAKLTICVTCGGKARRQRKYCQPCFVTSCRVNYETATLQSFETALGSRNSYTTSIHGHARSVADSLEKKCRVCGYARYVECCHIRPVKSFPKETLVKVVNAIDNLVWLCPTHHKELDNGWLSL